MKDVLKFCFVRGRITRGRALNLVLASAPLALVLFTACGDDEQERPLELGAIDGDADGWPRSLDCDDADDSIFPAADEIPGDGIDQDCSGSDESRENMGGSGPDGSGGEPGWGGAGGEESASGGEATASGGGVASLKNDKDGDGYVAAPEGDDCDDERLAVHPGAQELPLNGIDENCDGSDLVGAGRLLYPLGAQARPFQPPAIANSVVGKSSDANKDEERFLLVWSDSRRAPGQDIYGQLLDDSGAAVGTEIPLEVEDNNQKTHVRLVSKGDGFLATWVTVEGLFVRQLAADGQPVGPVLGYAPAGSIMPAPAYSAGHWAVAWLDGAEQQGWIRAMTLEGARGEVLKLGEGQSSAVTLVGRENGFAAGWTGPLNLDSYGIWLQQRSLTGFSVDDPVAAPQGNFGSPVLSWDGENTLFTFVVTGNFNYVAAFTLDDSLQAKQEEPTRLSSETLGITQLSVSGSVHGFVTVWSDARHLGHAPPAMGIYGNGVNIDSAGTVLSRWPGSQAQVVDSDVRLGSASVGEMNEMISLIYAEKAAIFIVE